MFKFWFVGFNITSLSCLCSRVSPCMKCSMYNHAYERLCFKKRKETAQTVHAQLVIIESSWKQIHCFDNSRCVCLKNVNSLNSTRSI